MTFHGNDDVNYSTLILVNCKKTTVSNNLTMKKIEH